MPKYYDEEDVKPKRACDGLRTDLKTCLVESDCVRLDRNTPKACLLLGSHPTVPDECQRLRISFFECKRAMLDMRLRFRGKKGY